jgi:hypothetical protein
VVSTVGAQYNHENEMYVEIGYKRYYETRVCRAKRELGMYWDVDTCKQLRSKLPWYIEYMQTESDMRANEMHEAIVEEFTQKLATGMKL